MRRIIFYVLVVLILFGLVLGLRAIMEAEGMYPEAEAESIETAVTVTPEPTQEPMPTTEPTTEPTEEPVEEYPPVEPMKLLGTYKITGYDPLCEHCCGKSDGITASGAMAVPGYTAAMADVPFGTVLYIDGIGTVVVQDRGPAPGIIDIACVDHDACYAITGVYEVYGEG